MDELCGDEVVARFGPIGTIDDLYIDSTYWQVRYLEIAMAGERQPRHMLLSSTCVAQAASTRDRVLVNLSRSQIEGGAGIWPMEAASAWLEHRRLYSARAVVGLRVEARDGAAGCVADILVDDEHWTIDYLIADMASPRGRRQVLVPLDWVGPMDVAKGTVYLRRTREQLSCSPSP
jgi:hypothetical protein